MANVETLGTLERRVSMALAADDIERKVDARLKQLARNVRMPGFPMPCRRHSPTR
jgi:trigger factor